MVRVMPVAMHVASDRRVSPAPSFPATQHTRTAFFYIHKTPYDMHPYDRAATPLPLNLAEMMDLLLTVHGQQILHDGCFNGAYVCRYVYGVCLF